METIIPKKKKKRIMPDWWDSIRAITTLLLTLGFIYQACVLKKIDPTYATLFTMAIVFYFKEKKRKEDNGNPIKEE